MAQRGSEMTASAARSVAAAAWAAAALALAPAAARAQFANMDINALNAQMNARMNQQMAQQQNSIVASVLNNPQAMALYPTCGRGLTPQQFAYKYAATGGCTAAGYRAYMNQSQQMAGRQQQAWRGVQQAEGNYRDAYNGWTAGQSANMQEAGRGLTGQGTYYDPSAGRNVQLGYLPSAQPYRDPNTGRVYAQDGNGQYWSTTGDGRWTQVNPARRSPR